jgi:hypothetical protein
VALVLTQPNGSDNRAGVMKYIFAAPQLHKLTLPFLLYRLYNLLLLFI